MAASPDVEKILFKFLKQILRRQTSSAAIYGELGRVPLNVLRKVRILKYRFKFLSSPQTLLQNKIYSEKVLETKSNSNEKSWAANLKCLIIDLGFSFLWNQMPLTQRQLSVVIQRVYDTFLQEWYAELNSSGK